MSVVKAEWAGGMRFVHRSASGHAVVTDASVASGGNDTAPSPMELILHGLVGCTGVDVISILQKMKQPVTKLTVSVDAERADEHPKVYTRLHVKYVVHGDVDERKLKRAIGLSEKTYCSATVMLAKTAKIDSSYEILPTMVDEA
jgi:putative redox protein